MRLSSRISQAFSIGALCSLFLTALSSVASPSPSPPTKIDPILGERIVKGGALDGRLWLQGTMISRDDPTGGLVSFDVTDKSRQGHFDRGVLDIQSFENELWVLRSVALKSRVLIVSVWRKGTFEDLAQFELPLGDDSIVLLNGAGVPRVLSRRAIRTFSADSHKVSVVDLKGKLRQGVQTSVATPASGDVAYVGFNSGEWGGGLQRVDLRTGVVTNIERRDSKQLCSGPLNSDCDPVTGVISDPQNKDCVLAAVGLVHLFTSEGRILRVCGESVTLVSEKPVPSKPDDARKQTEAFYGLVSTPDGTFWAISWRALYRFSVDGNKEYKLPTLKPVSGIYLSYDLPGVVVVRTDVNWAVSTSGYTPLVIPLASPQP
jgi:hypothetical protein